MSSSSFAMSRTNVPQAFVSSYAPRIRTYANSLLTPAAPTANLIAPLRTTKRGTTAINYSEDFDTESIDDSDAPRRPTGLRSLRQNESQLGQPVQQTELGKELSAPVDVQGIWREWMGKPKKALTEKQVHVQATLPLNLVPIRIDLNISPFQPEPPLPKPNNARDLGIDENSPAYKAPDMTPEYRLKDYFLWNLHEALMTPDQFAKVFVDELDFPVERRPVLVIQITQQIRQQLEDHAAIALHPLFNPTSAPAPAETKQPSQRPPLSRDHSNTPIATPSQHHPQTNGFSTPNLASTPVPLSSAVTATAKSLSTSPHNPDDAQRCVISLSLNLQNSLYTDKFEWSLAHPPGFAEIFAKQTCADIGLSGEWVPALAHSIYEAVLKLKKEVIENNGSILGIIGSGVNAWGEIDNEAAEVHGDGSLALGEGAGWRFDNEDLGAEWQPRVETLSKDEIEKREGDRERQIRRLRRETAARATMSYQPQSMGPGDFYAHGLPSGEEERMGRGERSKKKRRFRSLSPTGRETPDLNAAFGGEQGKLSEQERQFWNCAHCRVWGTAVWAVRDGPSGSRTLCHNCGLLYERDKRLPPWSKDLYAQERAVGSARPEPTPQAPPPHLHHNTPSGFIPNIDRAARALSIQRSSFQDFSNLPDVYSATLRGGGPGMFEEYAIEGEDLDWTKVTDPRERKRLQNIINGRKYRERRLAAESSGQIGVVVGGMMGSPGPLSQGY